MTRDVPEWQGKDDNSMPPPRVRLRIFQAHNGRCYITGQKINGGDKWQLDHITALCNGGENRENNLAPVLDAPHKEKTKQDVSQKSKTARLQKKHLGITKKTGFSTNRVGKFKKKFNGDIIER
jgi:5-methylcytosine-specific restriction endonuclease McrA